MRLGFGSIIKRAEAVKTDKVRILVPVGCRSDAGLSAPIIKRLKAAEWCECIDVYLIAANYKESYEKIDRYLDFERNRKKPDLILCVGDRTEMAAAARAAFDNHIPIGHVYAGALGDTEQKTTLDDVNRFVISLYAKICFCEDYISTLRVADLWSIVGKTNINLDKFEYEKIGIYEVGITHMDDLITDESKVPPKPYDLVLYNPITIKIMNKGYNNYSELLDLVLKGYLLPDSVERTIISIGPNPDSNLFKNKINYTYNTLPHAQFLGLLKNCTRFITNSSAGYYEAPFFLKKEQIVWVGLRNNKRREYRRLETGASDKIVKILKVYLKSTFFHKNLTNEVF